MINFEKLRFILIFLIYTNIANASFTENNFLVISDIHLDQTMHAMDISPSAFNIANDLDQFTFKKLIADIKKNIQEGVIAKPKFIILLGDIVGHRRFSSEDVIVNESMVFNSLKNNFPEIPIFYTFGNNDSLQINYGPFKDFNQTSYYQTPYDVAVFNGGWVDGFLSTGINCDNNKNNFPCIIHEEITQGYYSAYLESHFRLISLNSVLFSLARTHINDQDAINQLQWLQNELHIAKKNHDAVLITMHISPGNNIYDHSPFWDAKTQADFLQIIKTYQDTIVAMLASHTHAEELKIIEDSNHNIITGIYFVPALSTSHGNNPALKTFYFAKQNQQWQLANYETFHFVIDKSASVLRKLYDYQNYYCANQNKLLADCLTSVTTDKMRAYLSAGNENYNGIMTSVDDVFLKIPEDLLVSF